VPQSKIKTKKDCKYMKIGYNKQRKNKEKNENSNYYIIEKM
jgi:hypothetical protein